MAHTFKGTDTTTITLTDKCRELLSRSIDDDHLKVRGDAAEAIEHTVQLLGDDTDELTLSHDELATLLGVCRQTVYSKNARATAAQLIKCLREGVESFYKED